MLVDTHAHLWWPTFTETLNDNDSLSEVIRRAKEAGVEKIIVPGTELDTSKKAVDLARAYPGFIYSAVGIHPEEEDASQVQMAKVSGLKELTNTNKKYVVAVGEIGLDTYTEELTNNLDAQKELFKAQCLLALELDLPVIIHSRQTLKECLAILDSLPRMPKGQFHCFSHDEEGLNEVIKREFYVSYCGNVSWSKRVRKLANKTPIEKLLLETDSPLMTPRNKDGELLTKQNEPSNVKITAQIIALEKEMDLQELEKQTTNNVHALFGI